jgi:broad specificity phosphatase PhoE
MRLYLVRHARTAWNVAGRAQGHTDVSLDSFGRLQAQAIAASLRDRELSLVLSSDLARCRETAEEIRRSTGAILELDQRLRERDLGEWGGMLFSEIAAMRRSASAEEVSEAERLLAEKPPQGESLREVWDRLAPVAERLRRAQSSVAVVCHGAAGALLLSHLLHGTARTARSFVLDNGAITELEPRPEGSFRLLRWNDASHLEALNGMEAQTLDARC